MRGKEDVILDEYGNVRITPAYAGKRRLLAGCTGLGEDHPRICGEKPWPAMPPDVGQGSPPHMRGKVLVGPAVPRLGRITPAYAGKRLRDSLKLFQKRDHPRICGEKKGDLPAALRIWGSPPHMRGKAASFSALNSLTGITPAYAGKSYSVIHCLKLFKDHPRICGEKILEGAGWTLGVGSPPHMRGKD